MQGNFQNSYSIGYNKRSGNSLSIAGRVQAFHLSRKRSKRKKKQKKTKKNSNRACVIEKGTYISSPAKQERGVS